MSDIANQTTSEAALDRSLGLMAVIIYALYLASFITGVTVLIGVALAYAFRGDNPEWVESHYNFQITGFWIFLVGSLIVAVLAYAAYDGVQDTQVFGSMRDDAQGLILLAVLAIILAIILLFFWLIRNARGLACAYKGRAVPDPSKMLGDIKSN